MSVGFARTARRVSVNARVRSMTDGFTMLTLHRPEERPKLELGGMLGTQVTSRWSLSLQQTFAEPYAGPRTSRTSVIAGTGVGRFNVSINTSAVRDGDSFHTEAFVGLSVSLAPRTHAGMWVQRGPAGAGVMAEGQRSLPLESGVG
jgi:hypothetical protein